jgi:sugar/nucleoside kinase (ribokinase family)
MWDFKPVVGIGDLVLDIMYLNNNLVGVDGGGSVWNLLCNVAHEGGESYAFGVCGNDNAGKIAINSLKDAGVLTESVLIKNIRTKRIHENVLRNHTDPSLICPMCDKMSWYASSYLPRDRRIPDFIFNLQKGWQKILWK